MLMAAGGLGQEIGLANLKTHIDYNNRYEQTAYNFKGLIKSSVAQGGNIRPTHEL